MRRQPNSILKSPTEHGDDSIPIPSSTQGLMNVRRRVSFGPQQIHEFTVESTYSQGTTDSNLADNLSSDSVQQQNTPHSTVYLGESMELTSIATFSEEDPTSFQNKKEHFSDSQPIPAVRVQCGRDLPVMQPTRVPLLEKPSRRNNKLPSEYIQDLRPQRNELLYDSIPGDSMDVHSFLQKEVCQKLIPKKADYSELSMEFTLMNKQNILPSSAIAQDTEQPVHLNTRDLLHNTSRMSWLNYSQNNFIDKVDESAQTTLNDSPITSTLKSNYTFDITLHLPSTEHVDKIRYERYLDYKRKISILRPKLSKALQEVDALTLKKEELENKYSEEVAKVRILKQKLADNNAAIRDRRAAIQSDVTSRLKTLKSDLLAIQELSKNQ